MIFMCKFTLINISSFRNFGFSLKSFAQCVLQDDMTLTIVSGRYKQANMQGPQSLIKVLGAVCCLSLQRKKLL